jgi:hypothetical protein
MIPVVADRIDDSQKAWNYGIKDPYRPEKSVFVGIEVLRHRLLLSNVSQLGLTVVVVKPEIPKGEVVEHE